MSFIPSLCLESGNNKRANVSTGLWLLVLKWKSVVRVLGLRHDCPWI